MSDKSPRANSDEETVRTSVSDAQALPPRSSRDERTIHASNAADNNDSKYAKDGKTFVSEKEAYDAHQNPDFPDGGLRAWLVVFGAMCNTFSTYVLPNYNIIVILFGFVNSWGTFQAHYQETILSDFSPSTIAWIGSLQYSLVFFPGLIVGRLFDLGYYKYIFLSSSILMIIATFLIAQCTKYWHFLLCQGIAVGLAAGGIFGPTTAVIAHWFKLRRGIAMGFVAVGSSIGGTVLPIIVKNLIPVIGFPWTMRVIGFILLVVLGCANLTLKPRLPPTNLKGGLLNLPAFKSAPYTIYCLSSFFAFLGLYTVLTYVSISALEHGISDSLSFYLLSIANASSLFGRFASGVMADYIGPANIMIPFTAVAGVVTYAWPFARSEASLIIVTIIYGFSSGAYVSLVTNPLMELGTTGDVGRRVGMFMSILALGALAGPPVSGAINIASGGFKAVGFYAGSMVLVGVALIITVRQLVVRKLIGRF